MTRLAALLVLALATLPLAAQNGPPPDNNWVYGPSNNSWNPDWNRRPNPRSGACFYTTAGFRGNHFCVRSGDRLPALPGNFGGNISSIRVFGRASVQLFNDRNFRNGTVTLDRTVGDLRNVPFRGGHTWNNRVSSIIVRR